MRPPITLPIVLLGAGGHARVLHALIKSLGLDLIGVCDPALAAQGEKRWLGVQVLGSDSVLESMDPEQIYVVNGVGQAVGATTRMGLFTWVRSLGFRLPALVHPTAWVADDVFLDEGVQIMAGAVIQPGCQIGLNTIVNTNANVDHDSRIGSNVHIAPGATLCGGVNVESGAFVGAGATVIQNVSIGRAAVVAAGATVVRSVPAFSRLIGAAGRTVPPEGDYAVN